MKAYTNSMDYVINSVILYTFENNSLTRYCWSLVKSRSSVAHYIYQRRDCNFHDLREPHSHSFFGVSLTMLTLQWLVMPNNLIFMGLHFVISKRAFHPDEIIMTDLHFDLQCMRIPCWPRTYTITFRICACLIFILVRLNARKQLQHERAQRGLSGELPVAFPGLAKRFRSGNLDSVSS